MKLVTGVTTLSITAQGIAVLSITTFCMMLLSILVYIG
jgi:hypothetical protein